MFNQSMAGFMADTHHHNTMDLWHQRLAHASEPRNKQMAQQGFIPPHAIRLTDKLKIGTDVAGPFPTDRHGNKYYCVFQCRFTKYRAIFPMKAKNENILPHFLSFVESAKISNPDTSIDDVAAIRVDGGGEFVEFRNFCEDLGIEMLTSGRDNPDGCGVEPQNKIILNVVRTVLHSSDLPPQYWSEAARYAVYTLNRTVSSDSSISPYEAFFEFAASVKHFRAFGSPCWVHLQKERRAGGKLADRATEHRVLSFENSTGVYRLLSLNTGKIVTSKHVTFNEEPVIRRALTKLPNPLAVLQSELNCSADAKLHQKGNFDPRLSSTTSARPTTTSPSSSSTSSEQPRKSSRIPPPMLRFGYKLRALLACSFAFLGTHSEAHTNPFNLAHARTMPDWDMWHEAAVQEYKSLVANDVFELVERPTNTNVIKSRWVLAKKFEDGVLKKYKGRLVAKGYSQQPGIDYVATFAPVVSAPSLRIILSLAAEQGLSLTQLDELYMEQPEGFRDPEFPDHVWKLKKSLYGLKQSPRCWYANLHSTLREYGFTRSEYDGCIYMRKVGDAVTCVTIYVDDIVIASYNDRTVAALKATLKKKNRITDAGKLENFLGLRINRNLGKKTIHISQSQFIKDALIKFGYNYCPPAKTPMDPTMDLSVNKDYQASADDINRFRSMVGTLSWIATWSIPEISFAVHKLQLATDYPEAKHFAVAGRVFKYLKGSGNKSIKLGGGTILRAYCDADFCTDRIDGKSVTGYIVFLGDSPVVWTSRLQKSVSTCTTEAEYLALGEY
ncbi:unnamed protein product, partial [Heterosigma akashiwo]